LQSAEELPSGQSPHKPQSRSVSYGRARPSPRRARIAYEPMWRTNASVDVGTTGATSAKHSLRRSVDSSSAHATRRPSPFCASRAGAVAETPSHTPGQLPCESSLPCTDRAACVWRCACCDLAGSAGLSICAAASAPLVAQSPHRPKRIGDPARLRGGLAVLAVVRLRMLDVRGHDLTHGDPAFVRNQHLPLRGPLGDRAGIRLSARPRSVFAEVAGLAVDDHDRLARCSV